MEAEVAVVWRLEEIEPFVEEVVVEMGEVVVEFVDVVAAVKSMGIVEGLELVEEHTLMMSRKF